jgi:hypothetical protein
VVGDYPDNALVGLTEDEIRGAVRLPPIVQAQRVE